MILHLPSFVLGYAAGVSSAAAARRLRPLLLELATTAYRLIDAVAAKVVATREDFEDLLAEARARVRSAEPPQAVH